jgi:sigma-B regulation protein RsbU (phosphoserine phosphatase)
MTGPDEPAFLDTASFFDTAPCGLLLTRLDGTVLRANATLLEWVGRSRAEVEGRVRFADLLTVGGRIYHETHIAPLLIAHGRVDGLAIELRGPGADRPRLPVLVTAVVDRERSTVRFAVFAAGERRAYEDELLRARRTAEHERAQSQALATTLQRTLLPPALPVVPGLESAAIYHSASPDQVGGDFYDLFPIGRQHWGFFLGDVCGKGPAAAVVTSLARYTLRSAAAHDDDPLAALANLDAVLNQEQRDDLSGRYCTVVNGRLHPGAPGEFELELATGGHPPPLILRADGSITYLEIAEGNPVGLVPEPRFTRAWLTLRPGDTLLLYTDGLTEARDTRPGRGPTARLGERGLLDVLVRAAPAGAAGVIEAVERLTRDLGSGVEDDVAALALGVPRSGAPA